MSRRLPLLLLLALTACGGQGESAAERAIREGGAMALDLRRIDTQAALPQHILERCDEPVRSLLTTHLTTRKRLAGEEGWRTDRLAHRPIRAIPDGEAAWRLFVPISHALVNGAGEQRLDCEMVVMRLHEVAVEDAPPQTRLQGVEVITRERWLALGMPEAWDDASPVPW